MITRLVPNSPGDGRGHGTFVAGIAAGSAAGYAGAAPQAKIVSLDVMDDNGMARTSDVIAAAQWIYEHKNEKNIRVANFSLHSTVPSNFTSDPLDKAVEKLWFAGVTVVAAAGNYGRPDGPSGVMFAPGNDPFVITVGALDLDGSVRIPNHDVPNWSAYGYTYDGFRKPEIAAAGRYMVGPVPATASLPVLKPENVVAAGYMRLSGTSFAAPVVAGAAAQILARHPSWTPDQVKGALMQAARHVPDAPRGSAGVGEVNAYRAAMLNRAPNPNAALDRYLTADPAGGSTPVFDAASWSDAARSNVAWDAVELVGRLLERRLVDGRQLVGRVLERRHVVRRDLERRARSGRRHLGGRGGRRGRPTGRHADDADSRGGAGRRGRSSPRPQPGAAAAPAGPIGTGLALPNAARAGHSARPLLTRRGDALIPRPAYVESGVISLRLLPGSRRD